MESSLAQTYGCLLEGEPVYNYETGYYDKIEMCLGNSVQSWNNVNLNYSKQNVEKVIPTGEKEVFRYTFSTGYELNCTCDHKILTPFGEMPIGEAFEKKLPIALSKILQVKERSTNKREQAKYRVLGLLLGDGSIKSSNIYLTNTNNKVIENFITLIKTVYPRCITHLSQHKRDNYELVTRVNVIKDEEKYIDGERLNYTPNDLVVDLREWDLQGKGSYDKFIPLEVFSANRTSKLWLLSGLWDSDGCLRKNGDAVYGTKSKQLANDIVTLIRQLGYLPTLNVTKENSYLVFVPHDCYLEFEPFMFIDSKKNRTIVKKYKNLKNVFPAHKFRKQIKGSFWKYCKENSLNYDLLRKKELVVWENTNLKDEHLIKLYEENYFIEIKTQTNIGKKKVYDLSINPLNPWFLGSQGVLVHNCLLYQEQFMLMVKDAAGFNMGEADMFRRCIGWPSDHPKYHVLEGYFDRLVAGMREKGYTEEDAEKFLDYCKGFMGYSYNKSHALAYAYLAMQTLFLKTYYPVYFYTNLLNIEKFENYQSIIADAIANGVNVLPPSVNKSEFRFKAEGDAVRIGFKALKGFGNSAMVELEEMNLKQYDDIYTILQLPFKKVNKKGFACLLDAGAFDEFGIEREKIETIKELYKSKKIPKWFTRASKALDIKTMPEELFEFPEKIIFSTIENLRSDMEEIERINNENKVIKKEAKKAGVEPELIEIEVEPWDTLIKELIPYIKSKPLTEKQRSDKAEAVLGFSMEMVRQLGQLMTLAEKYPDLNLKSITAWTSEQDLCYWFLLNKSVGTTKRGNKYLTLTMTDNHTTIRAKCWNVIDIEKGKAYVSHMKKNEFGYSLIQDDYLTEIDL